MEIAAYQNQEPEIIAQIPQELFQSLIEQKIYKINPKFSQNQKCMRRLVEFIRTMELHKQSLKTLKELIKFYQIPILYFCEEYYKTSQIKLVQLENQVALPIQKRQKIRQKLLTCLQQIASICDLLTKEFQSNQFLLFFKEYGLSQKQISLKVKQPQYFAKYFKFLSTTLNELKRINIQKIQTKQRQMLILNINAYITSLIKGKTCTWLQKITFNQIIENIEGSIKSQQKSQQKSPIKPIYRFNKNYNNINEEGRNDKNLSNGNMILTDLFKQDVKNIIPCCRTYFFKQQQIIHPETAQLQYKNYRFPYDKYCNNNLKKTICGFLNRTGGVILIGIFQNTDNKKKHVKGQVINQNGKERILKDFRGICEQVYPDIVNHSKYNINFVPIKEDSGIYIPGKYAIRVHIHQGDSQSMYSYNDTTDSQAKQLIAFRTPNQVIRKQIGQQILQRYKQKLQNPKKNYTNHHMNCPLPDIGDPITYEVRSNNYRGRQYFNSQKLSLHKNNEINRSPAIKRGNRQFTQRDQQVYKINEQIRQNKRKQIKPDYVYFNRGENMIKKDETKQKSSFFYDHDDQQQKLRRQKLRQNMQNISVIRKQQKDYKTKVTGKVQQQKGNEQENDQLDFKPLNRQKGRQSDRIPFNPAYLQRNLCQRAFYIEKGHNLVLQNYQVKRQDETNIKAINNSGSVEFLIVGFPHERAKQMIKQQGISLSQAPIECNNEFVTWVKAKTDPQNHQKTGRLMNKIARQHTLLGIKKIIKVRKLFRNLYFQDQILLNKLVSKFKHDEQFTDKKGVHYYQCRNNWQSIQGFILGWQKNIKIKFMSDDQLKKKRLEYLESKRNSVQ